MSFITAAAIGGGALAGGYLSGEASKDAAEAGADASGRASQQVMDAANQARREVKQYIPAAQQDLLAGYSAAADIFGQALPEQQRLLSGGNLNAQQTTAGGYDQYKSALMGLPVDQSNWAAKQVAPSAPIQNPFQAGMFNDISQVGVQQQSDLLGGLETNREIISAINDGRLGAEGVNTNWFNKRLKQIPEWGGGTGLNMMMNWTPEKLDAELAAGDLGPKNQEKFKQLVSELQRLRG